MRCVDASVKLNLIARLNWLASSAGAFNHRPLGFGNQPVGEEQQDQRNGCDAYQ